MSDRDLLFYHHCVLDVFAAHSQGAAKAVDDIPADQFAASTDDQLVEHVLASMRIEPLILHEDRMEMAEQEGKLDVTGDWRYGGFPGERTVVPSLRVTISIPFTGEETLWRVRPNPHYMNFPRAQVKPHDSRGIGQLILVIERTAHTDPKEYRQALDEQLKLIREFAANLSANIDQHHQALPGRIREAVQNRRKRLDKQSSIRSVLNIPLARRPGAPDVQPIAVPRKLVRPLPPAPSANPELGIRNEDYEHILSVMRHEGLSFETTPETFAKHDEEELRDIILAHLNGHYQGMATGERFRKKGKTDICIEAETRAAFVAECKVWRGAKECGEAADQLLSYLTWRDCKCALVFFNTKNAGFAAAQEALASSLRVHPRFVSDVGGTKPGEWRFRFKQPTDDQRIVTVHVFFFDLFVRSAAKKSGGGL